MPEECDLVEHIFNGRGAYGRFKALLEDSDLLQSWYDFENQREEEALREWIRENKVELEP